MNMISTLQKQYLHERTAERREGDALRDTVKMFWVVLLKKSDWDNIIISNPAEANEGQELVM